MAERMSISFGGTLLGRLRDPENPINDSAKSFSPLDSDRGDDDLSYETPNSGERHVNQPAILATKKAKPIVADYDANDARLIELKQQGFNDAQIARKLAKEGRFLYQPRSISSRHLRLRKASSKADNDILDDELSDWHDGEDEMLYQCVAVIEAKHERDIQRIRDKKWADIAQHLATRMSRKKYTAKACRERIEALQRGTALLPIELDADQEGRRIMRETRIRAAKEKRVHEALEAQNSKTQAQTRKEQKIAEVEQKKRLMEARLDKLKKAQEAAARLKAERAAEKQQSRAVRRAALKQKQVQKQWESDVRKAEMDWYAALTNGKKLGGAALHRRISKGAATEDEDDEDIYMFTDSDDDGDLLVPTVKDSKKAISDETAALSLCGGPAQAPKLKSKSLGDGKPSAKPLVTKATLQNPRSVMSEAELEALLVERGLPRRSVSEDHPHLVARLCAADDALTTTELHDLLRRYFAPAKGCRFQKVRRLAEEEASRSAAWESGVRPTDPEFVAEYEGYKGAHDGL